MEGCAEVHRGVYYWLPLATIDLVGDNREFEDLKFERYLRCYIHYGCLIVSEF